MMTNSEIVRKITQKGIPEGMTLGQAFSRAIKLEAGYQLSEGVSLARPPEVMQIHEVEEVDEIGAGQKRSRDVVCWQCGEKGHLQWDCPYKIVDGQDNDIDDPNAYAGKSKQIIRITQPITVATRDNVYKHMGSQRTKANLCKAGYRNTKVALQEQQRINAAMATTLAAQNTMNLAQATVAPPKAFQLKATQAPSVQQTVAQPKVVQQQQMTQVLNTAAQVIQVPATPGPPTAGSVQNLQGTVRYIRVPAGTTKAAYNLRPATLNNVTTVNTPAMVMATPVTAGRGWNNFQMVQVKQEPPTPGNVATPKTTSTTTVVKRGKGRGKKAPTISVLDTTSETGEYYIEVDEDDLEDGASDAPELYEILANMNDPEIEELEMNMEPEMEPSI